LHGAGAVEDDGDFGGWGGDGGHGGGELLVLGCWLVVAEYWRLGGTGAACGRWRGG
jgi:hypothetical protein